MGEPAASGAACEPVVGRRLRSGRDGHRPVGPRRDRSKRAPRGTSLTLLELDSRQAPSDAVQRNPPTERDGRIGRREREHADSEPGRAQAEGAAHVTGGRCRLPLSTDRRHSADEARRGLREAHVRQPPRRAERPAETSGGDGERPPPVIGRDRVVGIVDRDEVRNRRPPPDVVRGGGAPT